MPSLMEAQVTECRFQMKPARRLVPAAWKEVAWEPPVHQVTAEAVQAGTEAVLISRAARGDNDAASVLVERLLPTIRKCIRTRRPRWSDEQDLVQVVFAKIFSNLHQFSGEVPLEYWVSRIAVNTSLSQIAHEKVRPECRMSDLTDEHQQFIEERWSTSANEPETVSDAREIIDLLLGELDPDERLIITLLHIEQRSAQEISQMTGRSISCIKVKAFRTRRKMRRISRRLFRTT